MKRLPPFGKTLDELQIKGFAPRNSVYLFVGNGALEKASQFQKSRPGSLCIIPYDDPLSFRWPVKKCDILIFDLGHCEMDYLNDLAYMLYQSQALIVRCVLPDFTSITFEK